jgi:hypothetical protein
MLGLKEQFEWLVRTQLKEGDDGFVANFLGRLLLLVGSAATYFLMFYSFIIYLPLYHLILLNTILLLYFSPKN